MLPDVNRTRVPLLEIAALLAAVGTSLSGLLMLYPLTHLAAVPITGLVQISLQFILYLPLPIFFWVLFRSSVPLPTQRALKVAAFGVAIFTTIQFHRPVYEWVRGLLRHWDMLGLFDFQSLWNEVISPGIYFFGSATVVLFALVVLLARREDVPVSAAALPTAKRTSNKKQSERQSSNHPKVVVAPWSGFRKAALAAAISFSAQTAISISLLISQVRSMAALPQGPIRLAISLCAIGALIAMLALIAKTPAGESEIKPLAPAKPR